MSKFKKGCLWGAASTTTLLCALATTGTANASGFQLRETSGTLQGSSFAGMSTLTSDASTMVNNPGSVGQYQETSYSVGGTLIMPVAKATNIEASGTGVTASKSFSNASSYKDMAQDAFVPNAHAVFKLTDQLNLGISITSPWGLVTDYEPDFAGRFHGTTSSIKSINIKPVLAYRFDNGLSFGAGPQIQQLDAALSRSVPELVATTNEGNSEVSGDDIGYGWQAGINWEVINGTRIGIAYNSEVRHNLEGKVDFDSAAENLPNTPYTDQTASATVITPESFMFGISQDVGEKLTIMADAQWTNWNSIDTLTFNFGGDTNAANPGIQDSSSEAYQWGSSWFGALGARYQYDENWTFTGGLAADETPIKTKYRNVRLPDSNRYWISLGTSYNVADWAAISFGYTHVFADTARVDLKDDNLGNFAADYDAHIDIIALQAKFQF